MWRNVAKFEGLTPQDLGETLRASFETFLFSFCMGICMGKPNQNVSKLARRVLGELNLQQPSKKP